MLFGNNCEFEDIDACVAALTEAGDVEDPAAACAAPLRGAPRPVEPRLPAPVPGAKRH